MTPQVQVIRSGERFHTQLPWLNSRHSFSFGHHYDEQNTHHGLLLVSNDDIVRAGTGFQTHPHRDMEIVTWVLDGELEHQDSEGHRGLLYPGLAQRMSAGTGIWHSEMNPRGDRDVHFIQMWVPARHPANRARVSAARHHGRSGEGRPGTGRVWPGT
jgi:quercetin 2,3-dioxygenase